VLSVSSEGTRLVEENATKEPFFLFFYFPNQEKLHFVFYSFFDSQEFESLLQCNYFILTRQYFYFEDKKNFTSPFSSTQLFDFSVPCFFFLFSFSFSLSFSFFFSLSFSFSFVVVVSFSDERKIGGKKQNKKQQTNKQQQTKQTWRRKKKKATKPTPNHPTSFA